MGVFSDFLIEKSAGLFFGREIFKWDGSPNFNLAETVITFHCYAEKILDLF